MTVPDIISDDSEFNSSEKAFLEAVLACQGIAAEPTEADFRRAMKVMIAYAQQVQDNPPEEPPSRITRRWLAPLGDRDRIRIAAAAFVRFGTTKPSIFQVRAAFREVFGDDLDVDRGG